MAWLPWVEYEVPMGAPRVAASPLVPTVALWRDEVQWGPTVAQRRELSPEVQLAGWLQASLA